NRRAAAFVGAGDQDAPESFHARIQARLRMRDKVQLGRPPVDAVRSVPHAVPRKVARSELSDAGERLPVPPARQRTRSRAALVLLHRDVDEPEAPIVGALADEWDGAADAELPSPLGDRVVRNPED